MNQNDRQPEEAGKVFPNGKKCKIIRYMLSFKLLRGNVSHFEGRQRIKEWFKKKSEADINCRQNTNFYRK